MRFRNFSGTHFASDPEALAQSNGSARPPFPSLARWRLSRSADFSSAIFDATSFYPDTTFVISEVLDVMTAAPFILRRSGACDVAAALLSALITAALMTHDVNLAPAAILVFAVLWPTVGNLHRFWWLTDEEAAARWNAKEVRTMIPSLNRLFDARFQALKCDSNQSSKEVN